MEYTQDRLMRQAREAIVATNLASDAQIELVAPKPNIPADVAFPTFKAARDRQMPPPQLASELASQISFGADSLLATASAAGPFLNFSIRIFVFLVISGGSKSFTSTIAINSDKV